MEQRFYKVRLKSGRVIGPLDLDRVKLFIFKEKITGLEMARLYPTGDWKDINSFPEVAELLMQKLEGKLVVDEQLLKAPHDVEDGGNTQQSPSPSNADEGLDLQIGEDSPPPIAPPPPNSRENTGTPQLSEATASIKSSTAVMGSNDDEATVMITADDERTVMVSGPTSGPALNEQPFEAPAVVTENQDVVFIDQSIAQEKTAMLTLEAPRKQVPESKFAQNKKKIVSLGIVICLGIYVLFGMDNPQPVDPDQDPNAPIPIVIPNPELKQDPAKSESIFKSALPLYYQDTVEGYKKAAKLFLKAANWDSNNVRALCLLASSYMNLIDVVTHDEVYFNTITRIIEMERAKSIDLTETVIADVELYLMLGNPDAAFSRIVDFAKTHEWGADMLYYLALTFYSKTNYVDALQKLNLIEAKDIFSPKIYYLFGQIYEKNNDIETSLKAFQAVVTKSPKHVKAHLKLAELYFKKDNLPEAGKHSDFIIHNKQIASHAELAKAYYFRGRMYMIAHKDKDAEALHDLEEARKLSPDDQDVLLDYYTLRARMPQTQKVDGKDVVIKNAPALAKMFNFLALGERSMKDEKWDDALSNFLSAREANDKDATPLLRIADVFIKKGDLQSAIPYYEKAVRLSPKNLEIYPKYIRTLISAYEFTEANETLTKFKEQNPDGIIVDRLQGEIFFREDRFREANTFLKKSLGASNYDSSVFVAYANLMFKTNNFRDSAFYYGLAQRFDPFNVDATVGIGKSLAELESMERGIEYVQNALQNSPYKAALMNGVAEIFLRKGNYDNALKYADNALTTDPKFALAFKTKGDAFAAKDKHKEALDAYLSYVNLAPLDPTGHIERHKLFLQKNEKGKLDIASAKLELLTVIKAYPHYPGIHYMLSELLLNAGDAQGALTEAESEIKANPTYPAAYVLMAKIYNSANKCQEADQAITKIIKSAQDYVPALIEAGIAKHCLKAYPAALSMLDRARSLDPGNPAIYTKLGRLYYDLANYDQMKAAFKKYLEVYPDAPDKGEIEDYLKKVQ